MSIEEEQAYAVYEVAPVYYKQNILYHRPGSWFKFKESAYMALEFAMILYVLEIVPERYRTRTRIVSITQKEIGELL
jgi:hypothetical protein